MTLNVLRAETNLVEALGKFNRQESGGTAARVVDAIAAVIDAKFEARSAAPETTGAVVKVPGGQPFGVVCNACGREIFVAGHRCNEHGPGAEAGKGGRHPAEPTDEERKLAGELFDAANSAPKSGGYFACSAISQALANARNAGRDYERAEAIRKAREIVDGLTATLPSAPKEEPAKGGAGEG